MGKKYASDLSERSIQLAVEGMKILGEIHGCKERDVVKYQLSKSATSIGTNYKESQSTTRKEFPPKSRISVRQALEHEYRLQTILALEILDERRVERLSRENDKIFKILKTILRTTSSFAGANFSV